MISWVTGVDPAPHFRIKAQEEELALWKSGGLVILTLWAPSAKPLDDVRTPKQFIKVIVLDADTITVLCLPENVAGLQSMFCSITNRVPMAPLTRSTKYGGDACHLPDGSTVDLVTLQKWLNDRIAAGWRVGVASRYDPKDRKRFLIATRQRPQASSVQEAMTDLTGNGGRHAGPVREPLKPAIH
jgi:hypothetical protein